MTGPPADAPPTAGADTDDRALQDLARRYPGLQLAPVVVLIPAYNEGASIAAVIDAVPRKVCDLEVSTLVVVDGATDDTAQVARAHGAITCVADAKRGQGAALALGYRVAATRGARFVVTVDADGQYDPAETERLVRPLVEGQADLVLGSRRLGWAEVHDRLRHAGVYFFSAAVSLMTGAKVTDSSSGFRAMTIEVPTTVALSEPQYQAAELLIGALGAGFRVAERPVTMSARSAGMTKKGHNIPYAAHYARVVARTWARTLRARSPRRRQPPS